MNRIRDLREDMDLRQIDVAEAAGMTRKRCPTMKREKHSRTPGHWLRWRIFFHVSIDYLIGQTSFRQETQSIL